MVNKPVRIGIIGAGPAGIMAALEAARQNTHVLLFDTNESIGRKLLVTGNGRCNISNLNASAERYACTDPAFVAEALSQWGAQRTLVRLAELGIPTSASEDGWCYPLSRSAATVAAMFEAQLELAGVEMRLKTKISQMQSVEQGWLLELGGPAQTLRVDRVIVATGGKAYPALGSTGEFLPVLARLGHALVPIRPALVPLVADVRHLHKLQGVRLDVSLSLLDRDREIARTLGNLMFTQFGFSGPAAMNVSHEISTRPGRRLTASIDLVPSDRPVLDSLIQVYRQQKLPLAAVLGAVMPEKLAPVLLPMVGLPPDIRLSDVSHQALSKLLALTRDLRAQVTGTREFKYAQLSTGGIRPEEVDPRTMQSRLRAGLYLAGEILDVVGPCGGFNLQWALTSGAIAGQAAATP